MATVEKIQDPEVFHGLRDEWNELLAASDSSSLFLTWEWSHTWWRHFSQGRRLSILTVRRDGRLVAIAPLALRSRTPGFLVPFCALEFLGMGSVGSDYLDVIVRRGTEQETVRALADHLGAEQRVLELAQFDRGNGSIAPALAGRLLARHWTAREGRVGVCPFITLSGRSWESFQATLGPNYRRNFKRRLRQMNERFDVRFELARSEDQRRQTLEALLALHERRWRDRGGSNAFHTSRLRGFHHDLSRLAMQRGWLRLYLLRLDGEPAASLYGFLYGSRFYFYQQGFDPRYARYSPGLVMTALTIQEAIKEGAREYDFLSGAEEFKFHWTADARELGRLELYPPGPWSALYRGTIGVSRATRSLARQVLPLLVRRFLTQTDATAGNGLYPEAGQ